LTATIGARSRDAATYQLATARYTSGRSQRQQCG
jgi:hypothetical protein